MQPFSVTFAKKLEITVNKRNGKPLRSKLNEDIRVDSKGFEFFIYVNEEIKGLIE